MSELSIYLKVGKKNEPEEKLTCILQLTLKQPQSILKMKFRAIYRSEKPRKKTFFTVKGGEGETHFKKKKNRIKASYQYKWSNSYCQDHLLCSTSTLRGHHLGRFQFDGEGNLAEMATIKSAFQIFLIKYSSWNSLRAGWGSHWSSFVNP